MWKLALTVAALISARVIYKMYNKPQAYCASCGTCYPESATWVKCSACAGKDKAPETVVPKSPLQSYIDDEMRNVHTIFDQINKVLHDDEFPNNTKKPDTKTETPKIPL